MVRCSFQGIHLLNTVNDVLTLFVSAMSWYCTALLDFEAPQTLVIVSGDGRLTPTGSSFPAQVRRALKLGWTVEIWSWKEQCTSAYRRMISEVRILSRS